MSHAESVREGCPNKSEPGCGGSGAERCCYYHLHLEGRAVVAHLENQLGAGNRASPLLLVSFPALLCRKDFDFHFMCMSALPACLCTMTMLGASGSQKRASGPLEQ